MKWLGHHWQAAGVHVRIHGQMLGRHSSCREGEEVAGARACKL